MNGKQAGDERRDVWEQVLLYARDLRQVYIDRGRRLGELEQVQAQLLHYARDVKQAFEEERSRHKELRRAYLDTVRVLAAAIEARDPYTGGHTERVAALSLLLAAELGWSKARLAEVEMGVVLHDIGKIGVDDAILRKPERLTPAEWAQIRAHPIIGARLVSMVNSLRFAVPYALYHHERYDGTGYPFQLAGEAIPVEGRLVAVADAFDAMTTHRPYRPALTYEAAAREIETGAGVQFDPDIARAFLDCWRRGAVERTLKSSGQMRPGEPGGA
jgi:HD-GYP domain-containing protein (c-di-GMP phosphodiesterase class II)